MPHWSHHSQNPWHWGCWQFCTLCSWRLVHRPGILVASEITRWRSKMYQAFPSWQKSGKFPSINILEHATVIINYAASVVVYELWRSGMLLLLSVEILVRTYGTFFQYPLIVSPREEQILIKIHWSSQISFHSQVTHMAYAVFFNFMSARLHVYTILFQRYF